MARHTLRFPDGSEWDIRVRRLPNGHPDVWAQNHIDPDFAEELPTLPDEDFWLGAIRRILEIEHGPAIDQ